MASAAAARFTPFRSGGYADVLLDAERGRVWKRAPITCTSSFVECTVLASTRHLPRLPATLHVYRSTQHIHTIQRYEGETLHEWSKRRGGAASAAAGTDAPPETLPTLARDVAVALLALRDVGVLHTDVKTTNVLVRHGRATLIDFNCISLRQLPDDAPGAEPDWGRPGTAVGTWAYAAPEVVWGHAFGEPAVVWAWAVTFACAWARGAHPVCNKDTLPSDRTAWAHLLASAKAADDESLLALRSSTAAALPPAWLDFLRECLRWDPARRPTLEDALAACERLDGWCNSSSSSRPWPRSAYATYWPPARPDAWPLAVRREAWINVVADTVRGSAKRRARFLTACYLLDRAAPTVVTDEATAARATLACCHVVDCIYGSALVLRPSALLGVSAADTLQMLWRIAERLHWALYVPCIDAMLPAAFDMPFEDRVAALAARTKPYTPTSLVADLTLGV